MRDDELDVLLAALTSVEPDPSLASRVAGAIEDRRTRAWRRARFDRLAQLWRRDRSQRLAQLWRRDRSRFFPVPQLWRRDRSRFFPVPALAALALLLLAVGISWHASRPVASPQVAPAPVLTLANAPPAASPAPSAPDDPAWSRASAAPATRHTVRATHEREPWPNRLPALERAAALSIEPIERKAIEQHEIDLQPLSIPQLEVDALER